MKLSDFLVKWDSFQWEPLGKVADYGEKEKRARDIFRIVTMATKEETEIPAELLNQMKQQELYWTCRFIASEYFSSPPGQTGVDFASCF